MDLSFYQRKRVLVTGHTGFKGSWLCRMLLDAGAEVTGYALEPPTEPNLFSLAGLDKEMRSILGDVRDSERLMRAFDQARPEIVLHLAAQPIVRYGYQHPAETYATNVMGTVNLMECIRRHDSVQSVINVTTDKVYQNREWCWGYREEDRLDGFDPYSNSKSCAELVTHSYRSSYFASGIPAVSTVRAGNVIGGGDFAQDRIIPDCVRAQAQGKPIGVRNPRSIRPYQHVLEPLAAYLLIARRQWEDPSLANGYNIGPDEQDCITTGELVDLFCSIWGGSASWTNLSEPGAPHEAGYLKLDCSLLKSVFQWRPTWRIRQAMEETCHWSKVWLNHGDILAEMRREIARFSAQTQAREPAETERSPQ